jgi:hypothetical protein
MLVAWHTAAANIYVAYRSGTSQSSRNTRSTMSKGRLHDGCRELATASRRSDRVYVARPPKRGLTTPYLIDPSADGTNDAGPVTIFLFL